MCNIVHLSTDSPENLAERNTELVRFEKVIDRCQAATISRLLHPHVWYVGSKSGCSCTFRRWLAVNGDPEFGEPVDWYPEKSEEIEATHQLYIILDELLTAGYQVDLVDAWEGESVDKILDMPVALRSISPTAFRLFERYRFVLSK